MTIRAQLYQGEKDGQDFPSPWPENKHPSIFYAIPCVGDEEIAALGDEVPEGLRTELSTLAYSFTKSVETTRDDKPITLLQYYRTPELDNPRPKPTARPRTKKQGP